MYPLSICRELFTMLADADMKYCHWKSNEHLDEALAGLTDLDLLIDPAQSVRFYQILKTLAIKRLVSPPEKQYPGMSDYLGFDRETGRLIHLHVHEKLIIGQQHTKNYHLPIEQLLLEDCASQSGVRTPQAAAELMILTIRALIKLDCIAIPRYLMQHRAFPQAIVDEFKSLADRCDGTTFRSVVVRSGIPVDASVLWNVVKCVQGDRLGAITIMRARRHVFRAIRDYRLDSGIGATIRGIRRRFCCLPLVRRLFRARKKVMPDRGCITAIVGADGSGKSTLVADLAKWSSWKNTTVSAYLGIPKTMYVNGLNLIVSILRRLRLKAAQRFVSSVRWLHVARYRGRTMAGCAAAAAAGGLVVLDRYPMKAFRDMAEPMDGPRLRKENSDSPQAVLEETYYDNLPHPDLIIVLKASLGTLRRRKSDLPMSTHEAKVAAINAITATEAGISLVDAEQPYTDVLLEIKRHIWEAL